MRKKKPTAKPTTRKPIEKNKSKGNVDAVDHWLAPVGYGIATSILYYLVTPLLPFYPTGSLSSLGFGTLLCGALGFVSASPLFVRYSKSGIPVSFVLLLLHIGANLCLTNEWLSNSNFIGWLASVLTIPLAVLWYFIFRSKAESADVDGFLFSFKNSFRDTSVRIAAGVVILISAFLLFYKLGYYDIWEDENLVINAAIGIQEQGFDHLKEGYDRAWIHSWMISNVFDLFGVSEFNGRLISALSGLAFVIICFYVFGKWYGVGMLAVLIPIVCLMNDRFLLLFRYMRMYALLIPFFLLAVHYFYNAITISSGAVYFRNQKIGWLNKKLLYAVLSVPILILLAHIHKLSMIVLPVFAIFIVFMALKYRTKELKYALYSIVAGLVLLLFMTYVIELDQLQMFRQVSKRLDGPNQFFPVYYSYMFENALPMNSTLIILLASLGLQSSNISQASKNILLLSSIFIAVALVSMIYLIAGEGKDYRYIAHIVPLLVGMVVYGWYHIGKIVLKKNLFVWLFLILGIASIQLIRDYERAYIRHPWAPFYSKVYETLKKEYKPGEALFYQNIKTFYLDPDSLAGEHVFKLPKKKEYTLDQFRKDALDAGKGWVMYEQHKSYHWDEQILKYLYTYFKMVHGTKTDDYGIDLFYFDETMVR